MRNVFKSDNKAKKGKKAADQDKNDEIESHSKCLYCKNLFQNMNGKETNRKKYRIRRFLDGKQTKKDEEFFKTM